MNAPQARRSESWITQELIEDTLAVWQPYYVEQLTEDDAIEILTNMGRLLDILEIEK